MLRSLYCESSPMSSEALNIAVGTVVFLLGLLGIVFNAVTLTVLARSKKLRGPFHVLLMSLCVSDAIAGSISLVWAVATYLSLREPYSALCKYADAMTYFPTGITVCHVSLFCIFRFVSCRWPHRKLSSKHAKWTAGLVWGFWTSYKLLFVTLSGYLPKHGEHLKYISGKFGAILLFVSAVVITILTVALLASIFTNRKKVLQHLSDEARNRRKARDKQITVQLLLIVLSFYLGYIPLCGFLWLYVLRREIKWFYAFRHVAYLCLRVSECLNPLFYNVASGKLWNETKDFLKSVGMFFARSSHRRLHSDHLEMRNATGD